MYKKSDRVLTLEKQLGKLQKASKAEYQSLHESFEKRKMKIAENFLDSIKEKLNLEYSINSGYSGFNIWNEEFQARFEIILDEKRDFVTRTSNYELKISQNSWFNSFSNFKPELHDKKEIGKYFFLKDYLTIVEEVTMSNLKSELEDLFVESRKASSKIDSLYGLDISNLTSLIREENEKIVNSLMESITDVRYNKPEVEKRHYTSLGFKILKRTPKKMTIKNYQKGFDLSNNPYEEQMKKEELRYYIESPDYDIA